MNTRHVSTLLLAAPLALGACTVAPPTGPTVLALPPQGKDLAQFQGEDARCRDFAFGSIGQGAQGAVAGQAAVGSAVAGTAIGAGAGALLGAAGGAAGAGAAVGAGVGLLAGSAIGANQVQASGYGMQARYDAAYSQCMVSAGNTLQSQPVVGYGAGYAWPYSWPYAVAPGVGLGVYYGGFYRPWYGYGWRGGWHGGYGRGWHGGGWRRR